MAQEETLRYKIQVDTTDAQPVIQNMVASVGQAISTAGGYATAGVQGVSNTFGFASSAVGGSYNSLQQGYNMAAPAFGGAAGSLAMGAAHVQNVRASYAGGQTAGVFQGAQNAAAAFDDPNRNFGSVAATGAIYGTAAIAGWTGIQAMSDFGGRAAHMIRHPIQSFRTMGAMGIKKGFASMPGLGGFMGRTGSAMMGRLGFGAVGRGLGYAVGGLSGLMLPFMAVDMAVNQVMDDVNERNEAANAIGQYDSMHRGPFSGSGKGSRFSKSERLRMADFMKDYADEIDRADFGQGKMGFKGMTEVLSGFQQQIFRDPNLTPKKFREVFTKKVEMVRDFAMAFDKTIGESVGLIKKLQGITGFAQDPRQTAAMVGAASNVSGISTIGMLGMAQQGAGSYLGQGLTRAAGANVAIQGAADFGTMFRTGMISSNDFARVGGTKGMTQMQVALQGAFTSGPFGQMIAAAALQGGRVNANAVNNIISGQTGTGQMLSNASGLASGGINALSNFYANKDKLVQQLSPVQQQGLVGSMAIRMLNMTGMDANQANLQTVFASQFGMNRSAARILATRIMNPQIYQQQMNAQFNRMQQKAQDAEKSQHGWGSWLYRATRMEAAGNWFSRLGTAFRREISNPIGNAIDWTGRKWTEFKDSSTGTQRLNLRSDLNDIDSLYQGASTRSVNLMYQMGSNFSVNKAVADNFDSIKQAAQAVRDRGGREPKWVTDALDENFSYQIGLGIAGDKISGRIAAGFQRETRIMKDIQMGASSGMTLDARSSLLKNAGFLRGVTELLREQEDGRKFSSAQAAQRIVSRGGLFGLKRGASLSDLTSSQRRQLGAAMAKYGIKTDDRDTGTGKVDLDISIMKNMQAKVKKAEGDLSDMFQARGYFKRQFSTWVKSFTADKEKNPFEYVYGVKFAHTMTAQSKETQADVARAMAIMSKGGAATNADKKKAKEILGRMLKTQDTLKGSDKAAFSKLVLDLQSFTLGRPDEITGNITKLGGRFRDKVDNIMAGIDLGKKLLAGKAQVTQFSRRMTMELISDDRAGAKSKILEFIKRKGLDKDDFNTVMKRVDALGQGDVSKNLQEFGKMYGEKKYRELFEIMKDQGGAYGKVARLASGLAATKDLQGRDLLANVADKDKNLKDMISGSDFKGALSNRKKAREQYRKIMDHIKKIHPGYKGDLAKIDQALESTTDERQKLMIFKKIIEGRSKGEGEFLQRIQIRALSGKVGGTMVSGSTSAGTYSRVAAKQIAVSQQVLQNLRIQHQTMKALYQQIKNGGKI